MQASEACLENQSCELTTSVLLLQCLNTKLNLQLTDLRCDLFSSDRSCGFNVVWDLFST